MKDRTLESFGNCVRELRLQQKMTQEELADKAGLHRTYIGMIERAEKKYHLVKYPKNRKCTLC